MADLAVYFLRSNQEVPMELIVEAHGVLVCKHQGRIRVMREKERLQEVSR